MFGSRWAVHDEIAGEPRIPVANKGDERGFLRRMRDPLIVFLAAVAVYANTLWGGFVFDDLQNIVQNR